MLAPAKSASRTWWQPAARDWWQPIAIFLAIRIVGLIVVSYFANIRQSSLGDALSAWDGKWMLAIAEYGYDNVPMTQTDAHGMRDGNTPYAFFPGYPMVVGALDKVPFVSPLAAALVVNLVCGAFAAAAAYRLGAYCARYFSDRGRADADPHRAGLWLAALLAAAPMGIVFSMAYTEAIFCALAGWALVGVLQRNWILAGLCAMAAGTTRPTAVVIVAVVMLAAALSRDGWRAWLAIVLSPLGYLGYLGVVWAHTGRWNGWFEVQTKGWGTTVDYGRATIDFVRWSLTDSADFVPVATTLIIVATVLLVGMCLWERLPWPVLMYGILVVASIVGSSGLMMSRPRLLLPAFVLVIPLAVGLARSRTATQVWALLGVVGLSTWFGAYMITVYPHAM